MRFRRFLEREYHAMAASVGGLFTRLSNTANTGRRLPFPPRRTQIESSPTSLAAKAFSSSEPSKAAAFVNFSNVSNIEQQLRN
jgi:hypothetical protein